MISLFNKIKILISIFFTMLAALVVLSTNAYSHPDGKLARAKLVLYSWVQDYEQHDHKGVEKALSEGFEWTYSWGGVETKLTRRQYLETVKKKNEKWRILFDHAELDFDGNQLEVSQLVWQFRGNPIHMVLKVSLEKSQKEWKITSVIASSLSPEFARIVSPELLPEHVKTMPVEFSLRDVETGEPVSARIHIVDNNGEYWPPRGHQKFISTSVRESVGGDVEIAGRTYAYVKPDFTVDLVPGSYEIRAAKGMEYVPLKSKLIVGPDENAPVVLNFRRWIDLEKDGWYAGDTHTHFLGDHNALLEAEAEGLNIISVLATKWDQLITDVEKVTGGPSPVSKNGHIVYFNEETRHNFLGHTILHPIKEPIYPLTWGGHPEGVRDGGDYPAMAHQADKAHAQGGIVTWAHLNDNYAIGELAIDVALGKIDSVDLFMARDPFRSRMQDDNIPSNVERWYMLLNTGARVTATAGTDKMANGMVTGAVRTYAYLGDKKLTYSAWAEAIKEGQTFVTAGPMLEFMANGAPIGSELELVSGDKVKLEATVRAPHDRFPWERFEIVQNGKVIASITNESGKDTLTLKKTVRVGGSAWFAARIYVPSPHEIVLEGSAHPPVAHTSPIYVDVSGAKVWSEESASFLAAECDIAIDWARNKANYHTEAQRAEVVSLFEKAKAYYVQE